jgi:hypothetical protein
LTPDEAHAWIPVVRDLLALLVGGALGTLGVLTHDAWLATAGFVLAGVVVDSRGRIIHGIASSLVRWWKGRKGGS